MLGDFSRVRIAEIDPDVDDLLPGQAGTPDLYFDLMHRSDLYELSRLLYRVMVNSVSKTFSNDKIENLVKHHAEKDEVFGLRIKLTEDDIQKMNLPDSMKNRMRLRFYTYELIEANYLTQKQMMEANPDLALPSDRVQDILTIVSDPNHSFESLFGSFLK